MSNGRKPRVAIVGATGIVGGQIADLIGEREFPHAELKLFATESGAFDSVEAAGESHPVARLDEPSELANFDIVFLAVPDAAARALGERLDVQIVIDLSAALRAPDAARLAAPGLTPRERIKTLVKGGRVAPPHPAAQVIATILRALEIDSGFVGASVITGASGAGREKVSELFNQTADLLNARLDLGEDGQQLAFNLFMPPGAAENAQALGAQISALAGDAVSPAVQIVQAPVFHGGGVALSVPANGRDSVDWVKKMRSAPGILFIEGEDPAGFVDAIGQEAVIVRMARNAEGAIFWCVFDAARVAAMTALWIAESAWFTFS